MNNTYTHKQLKAMEKAIDIAGENITDEYDEYLTHNIELNYLSIEIGRSGREIADYMDMDGHEGRVYVDNLEPLTDEDAENEGLFLY